MTRNATKLGRKKIPLDATPWSELKTSPAKKCASPKTVEKNSKPEKVKRNKALSKSGKVLKKKSSKTKKLEKHLPNNVSATELVSEAKPIKIKKVTDKVGDSVKLESEQVSAKAAKKEETLKEMKRIRKSESRRLKRIGFRNTSTVSLLPLIMLSVPALFCVE